jgi:hypothetical protein
MGNLHKTVLVFKDEDFPAVSVPVRYIFLASHKNTFGIILNLSSKVHGHGINGYCFYAMQPFADKADSMSDSDLCVEALRVLAEALKESNCYKRELPQPRQIVRTAWSRDLFSRGAYSAVPVGASTGHFDAFSSTPYHRVFFAGEHALKESFGCVHAAVITLINLITLNNIK